MKSLPFALPYEDMSVRDTVRKGMKEGGIFLDSWSASVIWFSAPQTPALRGVVVHLRTPRSQSFNQIGAVEDNKEGYYLGLSGHVLSIYGLQTVFFQRETRLFIDGITIREGT